MYNQNPAFIPGPTNMPDVVRRACDIATLDHRSAAFGQIFGPALAGVKNILGTAEGEVFIFLAAMLSGMALFRLTSRS